MNKKELNWSKVLATASMAISAALIVLFLVSIQSMKDNVFLMESYNQIVKVTQEVQNENTELKNKIEELNTQLESLGVKVEEIAAIKEAEAKAAASAKTTSRSITSTTNREKWIWQTFNASGYCSCAKCCGKATGKTASGAQVQAGVTVAMSKDYSFGTKIEIEGMGNTYVVQDRGGVIKGNKIDIYFDSHEQALAFGRKNVKLRIIE